MAKTKVSEFDTTPVNNSDINSIDIAENCAPSGINNAIRALMAMLKKQDDGTDAMTSPDIDGGTIDGAAINNTTIGATTASTGKFTTVEATTHVKIGETTLVEDDAALLDNISTTSEKINNVAANYTGNDLDSDLGAKAPLASPVFSGVVESAPTFKIKNSDNTNYWSVSVDTNNNLVFAWDGATKMTLSSDGNLNVTGTLTTGGDLDVDGAIVATGNITAFGTI